MTRIVGKVQGEIDVKRFYLPGVIIQSNCPKCGKQHDKDFYVQYLSYPVIGKTVPVYFYCEEDTEVEGAYCSTEWSAGVKLNLNLELINDKE